MRTITAFALVAAAAAASAQTGAPTFRHKIAINQGKMREIRYGDSYLPATACNGLQAMIIEKLQRTGQFVVMEREDSAKDAMNEEIDTKNKAGATPPQKRQAARYILTPEVTEFEFKAGKSRGLNLGGISLGEKKSTITFRLNIRIVDAETSQTLEVATGEAKQETKESAFNPGAFIKGVGFAQNDKTSNSFSKTFEAAIGKAVDGVCARIGGKSWSARVVAAPATGRLAINAGATSGLAVGQEFLVFKTSGRITDPETGEILSAGDETAIGSVRIARVEDGIAFCDVVTGRGFAVSNVVRPK